MMFIRLEMSSLSHFGENVAGVLGAVLVGKVRGDQMASGWASCLLRLANMHLDACVFVQYLKKYIWSLDAKKKKKRQIINKRNNIDYRSQFHHSSQLLTKCWDNTLLSHIERREFNLHMLCWHLKREHEFSLIVYNVMLLQSVIASCPSQM